MDTTNTAFQHSLSVIPTSTSLADMFQLTPIVWALCFAQNYLAAREDHEKNFSEILISLVTWIVQRTVDALPLPLRRALAPMITD